MSRPPKRSTVAATIASTCAASLTSHGCATASGSPRSVPLRDASPSLTPSSASRWATAAPIPRLAPVTRATFRSGSCFLQRSKDRVEQPETLVALLVGEAPARFRLDSLADANAGGDGLVHVPEDACGDAAEKCRSIRGAFVHRRALEREIEHGRQDPQPEIAARASARDATRARLDAEVLQQF